MIENIDPEESLPYLLKFTRTDNTFILVPALLRAGATNSVNGFASA
jgi:hypothetical protein